ncbi:MAG: 7-cyano-7-deazaguanine synthase QueC [Desulfovibrionaceae bacterium]
MKSISESSAHGPTTPPEKPCHAALVIFSGGQDSATCLAWALEHFAKVSTLGFDYGQRHQVEMACRLVLLQNIPRMKAEWKSAYTQDHIITTDFFHTLGNNALVQEQAIVTQETGLPNTFVPGRNLLFLSLAAAYAYSLGISNLVMGVCETDSSGYPDCRDDAVKAMQVALNIGMDAHFTVHTPLMWLNKAETWNLAHRLGGTELVDCIVEQSHTCYLGERSQRHAWGYGCGQCPACKLRAAGYERYCQMSSL